MCTAIICNGSRHWTTQPCLSLTRAVSTLRKVFGMRLHSTATMVCTSRRGGHCGTGFLCSLLNMADESGIASWEQRVKIIHIYIYIYDTLMYTVIDCWQRFLIRDKTARRQDPIYELTTQSIPSAAQY